MSEPSLDGLFTFFASHHAVRAEKVLGEAGLDVLLIPGPKELSPNCGTALRFEYDRREEAAAVLEAKKVEVDEVIEYVPRTDAWPSPRRSLFGRRRSG
jgi:hypothetical protein